MPKVWAIHLSIDDQIRTVTIDLSIAFLKAAKETSFKSVVETRSRLMQRTGIFTNQS